MGGVIKLVLDRECSIGIIGSLPLVTDELQSETLVDVPFVTVVNPHHPLAAKRGVIPASTLAKHVQLVLSDRTALTNGRDFGVLSPLTWRLADLGAKLAFLKAGLEDIALVYLTEEVEGVTPAPVADAGYLDGLDLTSETFTVVGYGTDEFVTGSVVSPMAITVYDGARSYRDVSVITTQDLFPDRFVKITKSVCFGDSGGPMFHDGTLVALNAWTFSYRCDGPNLQ